VKSSNVLRALPPATALGLQATLAIREAITTGRLPPGEPVTERSLARLLAVSATPVREALGQLEREGLIDRAGRKRTVAVLADTAHEEMALIHAALCGIAARIAAERASEAQMAHMKETLEAAEESLSRATVRMPLRPGFQSFHDAIEEVAQNQVLASFLSTTEAFDDAYRAAAVAAQRTVDPAGVERRAKEHRKIFEAIEARDADLAESLAKQHAIGVGRSYFAYAGKPSRRARP
jgi:DNA-binding GntR family transcriptional regulator